MKLSNLSDEVMLEVTILLDKDDIQYDIAAENGGEQTIFFEDVEMSKLSIATTEHLRNLGIKI